MSLSKGQDRWYWRIWGAVVRHCKANQLPAPDRHEFHRRALNLDSNKSHTDFDDDDFDDVMSAFYSIAEPDNFDIQVRFTNMRRTRRLFACRRNAEKITGPAGAENYIRAISEGKFHTTDWESLELHKLRQLRDTLDARARAHAKKELQPF